MHMTTASAQRWHAFLMWAHCGSRACLPGPVSDKWCINACTVGSWGHMIMFRLARHEQGISVAQHNNAQRRNAGVSRVSVCMAIQSGPGCLARGFACVKLMKRHDGKVGVRAAGAGGGGAVTLTVAASLWGLCLGEWLVTSKACHLSGM